MSLSGNEDFQIRSSLKFSAVPRLVYPLRIRSNGIPSRLSIITRDTKTFISVAEFHFQILVLLLSKKKKNSSCSGLNCDPLPEVAMNDPREKATLCWNSLRRRWKPSFQLGVFGRKDGRKKLWPSLSTRRLSLERVAYARDAGSRNHVPSSSCSAHQKSSDTFAAESRFLDRFVTRLSFSQTRNVCAEEILRREKEYRGISQWTRVIGKHWIEWTLVELRGVKLREVRHEGWFLSPLLFFSRIWREGFREGRGGRAILPGRPFLLIISYVSDDVETNYCASFRSPGGAFVARRCCLPLPSLSPSFLPSFLPFPFPYSLSLPRGNLFSRNSTYSCCTPTI